MKKLFFLVILLGAFLNSCSDDSDSDSGQTFSINGTKLRRTIMYNGAATVTDEAVYDGNRMLRNNSSNGNSFVYTYTGNLITKMEFFQNNVLENTTYFTYIDDKLTQYISVEGNEGYRVVYTYNNDNTIDITGYTGDATVQNTQTNLNKKVFLQDGLALRIEEYKEIDGNPETFTTTYTHDNANVPSSAVLGHDKLTMYDQGLGNYVHNVTSITKTATNSPEVYVTTITYLYNTHNLPYKMSFGPVVIDYFYE